MDIQNSIVALLSAENEIVGTGFVVADGLIVTCAHVLDLAKAAPGGFVRVRFAVDGSERFAEVDPSTYSPKAELDVAILRVSQLPKGVQPLRMSASAGCSGHQFFATGYPKLGEFERLSARGEIISLEKDKRGNPYLQLRSQEIAPGMSGGPVMDTARNAVVGMVNSGFLLRYDKKHRDTAFATPTETLWQVCPQLKPIVSSLPRRNPIVEGIHLLPYDYDQRIQNFLTEYLGTESHPVPFGGRDEALHMLDNWLAETTPYLLLVAPAGRGKSALLVRWLDSLKAREDLALAFVPVSIRFGTNMERIFYAALAARLAYLHGDDVPASPETSTAVYRGLVSDYLSKPLANGRTLMVVLDGLDEAADWQAGADFMPGELPAGVRVIVSARFLAGDADSTPWLRRLNWGRNGLASAPSLTPLDHDGVRDVLFKMGYPLDELSRKVDIVAELYRLSEGDPLLVGLYVGDLWAKGEAVTRLQPENLASIQPGYKGYFDRWWDDQKKLWKDKKPWLEKHVRAVRNLLSGALGPLFRADFQALEPEFASDYIADALDVLQRFIIGDNQIQGFTFSHPKLGQYFWADLTQPEQEQIEGHFLNWGERTLQELINSKRNATLKKEVPFYIVSNYCTHLVRANQPIEKYLPLIHHLQWAQAWFTVEGAYGGYSQDVQRVWERCKAFDRQAIAVFGRTTYFGKQIRCALINASLHSLAGNIPSDLIWPLVRDGIWTWPQAWVVIRQMPDSEQQAQTISALIPYLDNQQLLEALEAAREIKDHEKRALVFSDLAQRIPEVLPEAFKTIQTIQNEWERASLLSKLIQGLQEDQLLELLESARTIKSQWARACLLSVLTPYLPEVTHEALEATREIWSEEARARVLITLTQWLPKEQLYQVLIAARELWHEKERAEVMSALAQRLPEVAAEAREAAREVWPEMGCARLLSSLVQHLPEVADESLIIAQTKLLDEGEHIRMLITLAQNLPRKHLLPVLEMARMVQNTERRAGVLIILAQRLPDIVPEALATAQTIWQELERAHVLSSLALHLPERQLGRVLEITWKIQDSKNRGQVLSALAQRFPEVTVDALLTAWLIQDKEELTQVLTTLVPRLPEVATETLAAAWVIQDEHKRDQMLNNLVRQLPEENLLQALQYILAMRNEWERADMLSTMAQRLPKEQLPLILEHVLTMQNESERADVLNILAQRMSESQLVQILEAARNIQDQTKRAKVLGSLTERLPEVADEALAEARAIKHDWDRAKVLSNLAKRLPDVADEALGAARAIRHEWTRACVLSDLAQFLPNVVEEALEAALTIQDENKRAELLTGLMHRLPEGQFHRVLTDTQAFQDEEKRVQVLRSLALYFPKRHLLQLLEVAQAIQNEGNRSEILCILAQHLTEKQLNKALEAAQTIHNKRSRIEVLNSLVQRLPELVVEASKTARMSEYEKSRAELLSALAQSLPGAISEALVDAQMITDEVMRASEVRKLALWMSNVPVRECYLPIETSLTDLSYRTRADLFSDISAIMPVIIHLGTEDTPREIYEAVCDVTTWWP
jgi:hypothetical protein